MDQLENVLLSPLWGYTGISGLEMDVGYGAHDS